MRTRNKTIITGTTIAVVVMLMMLFFFPAGATPAVVKPTIRPSDCEDFEDDTLGLAPTEPWYTYTGDYLVDNDQYSVLDWDAAGYQNMTYFSQTRDLNISGPQGSTGTFLFNETGYFSIDFKLYPLAPIDPSNDMVYRFQFLNGSVLLWEMDLVYRYDYARYDERFDINDDGHRNYMDLKDFVSHYRQVGTPG